MVHKVAASAVSLNRMCACVFMCACVCAHLYVCACAHVYLPQHPINKVSCKCLKIDGEKTTNISLAMIAVLRYKWTLISECRWEAESAEEIVQAWGTIANFFEELFGEGGKRKIFSLRGCLKFVEGKRLQAVNKNVDQTLVSQANPELWREVSGISRKGEELASLSSCHQLAFLLTGY